MLYVRTHGGDAHMRVICVVICVFMMIYLCMRMCSDG